MNGIDIIDIKQVNLKGAYVIDGFPSVGLVGSIVANYLVSFLNLEQIAVIDSEYFPQVSMVRDGLPLSPVRIYAGAMGPRGQEKIAVFVSEFQPSPEVLHNLAMTIMDWVEEKKCHMVISPEGIVTREEAERMEVKRREQEENEQMTLMAEAEDDPQAEAPEEKIIVYGVGSTPSARTVLKQNDVPVFENGIISGLAGVLLNEGVARDTDVLALLAEAHAEFPDARAAAAIMEIIDKFLLHVELDTKPLLEEAALIENTLKEITKKAMKEEETSRTRTSVMYG
jgi:uncharacterized protein